MDRLERHRPLSEADCYARLYGQRDQSVTVIARRNKDGSKSGEGLREAFEQRLELRDPLDSTGAEAA